MSYFNRDMVLYPNYLFHNSQARDNSLDFDPENEPSITGETYTCSGGETSGPAYDLVDNRRDNVVTIDSNGETTNPTVDFDLTTVVNAIDAVIVDNHNCGTADAWIEIQDGGTKQALTTSYESSLSYVAEGGGFQLGEMTVASDQAKPAYDGVMLFNLSSAIGSSSDLQVYFTPDTAEINYSADIEVGEICFSRSWTAPHAPELSDWEDVQDWTSTVQIKTPGGQTYGQGTHGERKAWRLTFTHLTDSEKEALQQVYRVTKGGRNPMYFDLGEGANPYIYYGRFIENSLRARQESGSAWSVTFGLMTEY